jgi:D-3-phosphoglycerate dehydrogenase
MPKVLIADKLSESAVEVFRQRGVEAEVATGLSADELKKKLPGFDGLAIRSATKVTKDILEAAPDLKVIGRAGIGVDNIDQDAATARGVVVMNTPGGNSITTAEHALSLMLALARRIPQADASTKAGKWEKSKFQGVELTNKTLGLIGCGNIGAIVAERARGLRMKVIAYDPYLTQDRARMLGIKRVDSLDDLYASADFITLHVPKTEQTEDMIDKAAMAKMKPGVRIINCARGGLIVEQDLADMIEEGHVAGAAIDVYAEEPAKENPLFHLENTVCTPHLGASTSEAQEKVAVQVAEQMADYLTTGAISNALNMPSLTAEESEHLGPYMTLADQIGSFCGQLTKSGIERVRIEYEGTAADLNTRPITQSALAALLRPVLASVNLVNAPVVARERDIDVSEVKHERDSAYQTLVRVSVEAEGQTNTIAGTLFGGDKPRLVEINDIPVEAELGPRMLYLINEDKPGLIGDVGSTLSDAGINIATFHLGRAERGRNALALIEVDNDVGPHVVDRLRKLPHIRDVNVVRHPQIELAEAAE